MLGVATAQHHVLRKERAPKQEKTAKPKRAKAPKVKVDRGGKGKKVVGLKIGASQLAAARVTNDSSAELLQVAREPLSPGIVVGGELRDPDALALALRDFFAKHKLPKRGVRLGIANNRIGVRTFDVAGITDEKQLEMRSRVGCPLLLVNGTESWASNPERDGRAAAFPSARVVAIEGAGHWAHHDRFDEFMRVVRGFFAEKEG